MSAIHRDALIDLIRGTGIETRHDWLWLLRTLNALPVPEGAAADGGRLRGSRAAAAISQA
jgi:hypothetical protein